MSQLIDLRVDSGVATLVLNRPEKRNAINDATRAQLVEALEQVARDSAIRSLVITGNGAAFCAGGDISGMRERTQAPAGEIGFNGWKRQQQVHHAVSLLYNMAKPTIAAVNGAASGLGADLALSCDFVIAAETAALTWSYIHRGLVPDGGGLYFLPRRVGLSLAKELIFSGRSVAAPEALRLGIVDRICTPDVLLANAQSWAAELGARSPTALALAKSILNQSSELTAQQVFGLGSMAQAVCYASSEHRDAVNAFLNKGAPKA
jgi:enoyl-CoA hydratase/carnithine racemase